MYEEKHKDVFVVFNDFFKFVCVSYIRFGSVLMCASVECVLSGNADKLKHGWEFWLLEHGLSHVGVTIAAKQIGRASGAFRVLVAHWSDGEEYVYVRSKCRVCTFSYWVSNESSGCMFYGLMIARRCR